MRHGAIRSNPRANRKENMLRQNIVPANVLERIGAKRLGLRDSFDHRPRSASRYDQGDCPMLTFDIIGGVLLLLFMAPVMTRSEDMAKRN
jgi:hypothetical protein